MLQWVLGASAALPLLGALFGEASAASPRMDACGTKPDLLQEQAPAELAKRSPYAAAAASQTGAASPKALQAIARARAPATRPARRPAA